LNYFFPWLLSGLPVAIAAVVDVHRNVGYRTMLFAFHMLLTFAHFFLFFRVDAFACSLFAVISFQSAYAMTNSKIIYDISSLIFIVVATSMIGLVVEDAYTQLVIGIVGILGYVGLFYKKMTAPRREESLSIICLLLSFKMTFGYVIFVFNTFAVKNNALGALSLCLQAAFPWNGYGVTFWANAVDASASLVDGYRRENHLLVFGSGLILYSIIFISVRVMIGFTVMRRMHGNLSLGALGIGFLAYMIDTFHPFMSVFDAIYNKKSNKFLYSFVMCVYNVGEFFCAREFFLLRIFCTVLDHMVFDSGLIDAQRLLDVDVDLSGFVFEKPGAFPYVCLDKLAEISKCTKVIHARIEVNDDGTPSISKGVGLLRSSHGQSCFVTVRHLVACVDSVSSEDPKDGFPKQKSADYLELGKGIDPPVQMPVKNVNGSCSSIRNASANELSFVKYLVVISPEGFGCPISDFNIDRNGDINVSVNLKSGDSGSPVVGVIKDGINDGDIVLVGVVSRGSKSEGKLNVVSGIKFDGIDRLSGSPGLSENFVTANIDHDSTLHNAVNGHIGAMMVSDLRSDLLTYDLIDDFANDEELSAVINKLDWNRIEGDKPVNRDPTAVKAARNRVKSWKKNARSKKDMAYAVLRIMKLPDQGLSYAEECVDAGKVINFNLARRHRPLKFNVNTRGKRVRIDG